MAEDIAAVLNWWAMAMFAGDLDGVCNVSHPDIRVTIHLEDVPIPFVGATHGLEAARKRTEKIFSSWRFRPGEFKVITIDGNCARARMTVTLVHRWTGFSIDVKVRQQFEIENGLIRSYDGYTDAPRMVAFMRFIGLAPAKAKVPSGD